MTLLGSRLFCHFVVCFDVFFRTPSSCLSLIESVFFGDTFEVSFYSSIEFISLHSLFTLSFYFIVHIRYTHELYRRWAYL